ncbi:hypothetical protein [Ideonella livida]|uniref:Uncharacterized protein n=1 Tax=Ideonella livida TaxID=2707176 RepID=A0A7C9TIL5_9BURK|nr:hypothetical protein [Ideonella livida]NDY91381.1 hypothetical protein [Ideonella livida]
MITVPASCRLVLLGLLTVLSGCVYVPRSVPVYDQACQIESRRMEMEPVVLRGMAGCSNEGCASLLVASGLVTAASVVVSGSIVVAGNAVYWFEKRGRCAEAAQAASAPAVAAPR